jgi:uncharacterized protein YbjT (DUF2867 family)
MPVGSVGKRVVRELLAPEFSVRVLTREPGRLTEEIREQVEIFRGSTDDTEALLRALDGVEAMFWCVPAEPLQVSDLQSHFERHARAGCQALRQVGTPRVVGISAGGKGPARNAGPITGLHTMEDILNDSGAAIRHLRCGLIMEDFLSQAQSISQRGLLSYPLPEGTRIPMVAARDIADVALRWLVRRDWTGTGEVAVHGAEDLSFGEAATVLEQVLHRPVRYKEASANQYIQNLVGLGASLEYARGRVNMFSELAQGITRAEPRTFESTTPTTLSEWAETELASEVQALSLHASTDTVTLSG